MKSGGGKAERFHLVQECQARDIEPVVVQPGQLVARAEAAVAGGADVIGMAGGDGSLALVAGVAARHQVPMVVVPAGTRNHLAMDLGLDRGDVVGALDAYGAAVERAVDLGDVNGRPFVNNVSLGLYAEIIRSPAYRDAKLDTTLSALPGLLGPGSAPFDLRFDGPDGSRYPTAHLILVSNDPYAQDAALVVPGAVRESDVAVVDGALHKSLIDRAQHLGRRELAFHQRADNAVDQSGVEGSGRPFAGTSPRTPTLSLDFE